MNIHPKMKSFLFEDDETTIPQEGFTSGKKINEEKPLRLCGHSAPLVVNLPAGETLTDSKEIAPCSPNAEILQRLESVALRAVQFAGNLKDFSPEQKKIADLLDQANDLEHAEPLDVGKLAAVIGEIELAMKPEPKKTDGKTPPDDQTEYRNERAAILTFSANLPSDEAEYRAILERPCYTCKGRRFWVSIYDVIICGACHPPAQEKIVKRWIDLPSAEGNQ